MRAFKWLEKRYEAIYHGLLISKSKCPPFIEQDFLQTLIFSIRQDQTCYKTDLVYSYFKNIIKFKITYLRILNASIFIETFKLKKMKIKSKPFTFPFWNEKFDSLLITVGILGKKICKSLRSLDLQILGKLVS